MFNCNNVLLPVMQDAPFAQSLSAVGFSRYLRVSVVGPYPLLAALVESPPNA